MYFLVENCSYPKRLHGGNIWRACREFGGKPEEYLDFSSNINPLGPSPHALEAVKAALDWLWRYPDPDCRALKGALADYLGVPVEWLLPGNGTAELINLLVAALGIKRAVIPVPTFSEYAVSVTAWGGKVYTAPLLPEEDFRISLSHLTAVLPEADALFLCHPNNPTGHVVPREELAVLVEESARAGAFLVVDEAFLDFLPDRETLTTIGFLFGYRHVIVLCSLTKFFGLAGLRLGVLAAAPAVLAKIKAVVSPWNVNLLAQVAGAAAVADEEYINKTRQVVAIEREYLTKTLGGLPGVRAIPGTANFLLLDIRGTGLSTGMITRRLAEKRILVRDTSDFAGLEDGFIRVAVRLRSENRCLVEGLQAVLA
ncbi:MAG: threonine-phosphate decarboxylase [Ammonifex sp.]|nr:MAG: threonine-phosphate decarboxylase [Ammonifex sp.]